MDRSADADRLTAFERAGADVVTAGRGAGRIFLRGIAKNIGMNPSATGPPGRSPNLDLPPSAVVGSPGFARAGGKWLITNLGGTGGGAAVGALLGGPIGAAIGAVGGAGIGTFVLGLDP